MGNNIRIARVFGIPVEINLSWFLIFFLVAWSLSAEVFPTWHKGLAVPTYWAMGLATALVLFITLLLHELSHSLVSRRFGQEVRRITLFLFGGVSEAPEEMPSAKAEFWIAIAGPVSSLMIGGLFFAFAAIAQRTVGPGALASALSWLGVINIGLALFNLVPGYPLDGGRVLRSAIWAWTHDLRKATRWAAAGGKAFAAIMMGFGIVRLFSGQWFGGFWLLFLGWLLYQAAQGSYSQLVLKQTLNQVKVSELMSAEPVTLAPEITLREVVERYFMRLQYGGYPVMEGDRLVGLLTRQQVREIEPERWGTLSVSEVMIPVDKLPVVQPKDGVGDLIERLMGEGFGRLPVTEDGRLVGLLSQTDVMRYLTWHPGEPKAKAGNLG